MLSYTFKTFIGNKPGDNYCAEWGWLKWVNGLCSSCCVAIVLFKAFFYFYKHIFKQFSFSIMVQGWLLEYLSKYLYLKMPFARDYAFQILVMMVWYFLTKDICSLCILSSIAGDSFIWKTFVWVIYFSRAMNTIVLKPTCGGASWFICPSLAI